MLLIFPIILLLLSILPSDAAYVIYQAAKGGPVPIHKDIQKNAYRILHYYSWPNNIKLIEAEMQKEEKLQDKALVQSIISTALHAEKDFIEAKLQEQLKDKTIKLVWVPTSLFQLAAIVSLGKDKTVPSQDEIVNIHFNTNNFLLTSLHQNNYESLLTEAFTTKDTDKLFSQLDNLTKEFIKKTTIVPEYFNKFYKHSKNNSNLFLEVYKAEMDAYLKNAFILFRTATPVFYKQVPSGDIYVIDAPIYKSGKKSYYEYDYFGKSFGLSIANTLFAGFYRDKGACTFTIFSTGGIKGTTTNNLYALIINKVDYIHQYKDILYLPPSSIIEDLFKSGEGFHPRTVSVYSSGTSPATKYIPKIIQANEELAHMYATKKAENLPNRHIDCIDIMFSDKYRDTFQQSEDAKEFLGVPENSTSLQLVTAKKIECERTYRLLHSRGAYNFVSGKVNMNSVNKLINILKSEDTLKQQIASTKKRYLEENRERELTLRINKFLAQNIYLLYDGHDLIIHKLGEETHPENKFYAAQQELAGLVEHKHKLESVHHSLTQPPEERK